MKIMNSISMYEYGGERYSLVSRPLDGLTWVAVAYREHAPSRYIPTSITAVSGTRKRAESMLRAKIRKHVERNS